MMNDKPLYAVIGNPVAHSRSPEIHRQFAAQEYVEIEYIRICAEIGGFAQAAERFFAEGGQGANVTVPFKTDAFDWVDEHSERAAAGAVNTVIPLGGGRFLGDNTDGAGLVGDMVRQGVSPKGKHILLLGAGGAVRGVLPSLLDERPASVTVANRTPEKARALAGWFGVQTALMQDLPAGYFDVVINGTSCGLSGQLPDIVPAVFGKCSLAYDMVYGKGAEPFLDFARKSGAAKTADGLGMLVGPDAVSVIEYIRGR